MLRLPFTGRSVGIVVSRRLYSTGGAPYHGSSSSESSETAAAYLPWNARPWRMTYQNSAAEMDTLDQNIRSILCEDSTAMYKFLSSTLGKGRDVNDYVEDPVKTLKERRFAVECSAEKASTSETLSKKTAKSLRRRKPSTYIQIALRRVGVGLTSLFAQYLFIAFILASFVCFVLFWNYTLLRSPSFPRVMMRVICIVVLLSHTCGHSVVKNETEDGDVHWRYSALTLVAVSLGERAPDDKKIFRFTIECLLVLQSSAVVLLFFYHFSTDWHRCAISLLSAPYVMDSSALCFKCKGSTGSIPSRDGGSKLYCINCFVGFCSRTMKDTLFGPCALPCEEPIVVGVSGGPNSLFLLHQLGILRAQGALRGGGGATRFFFLPFHLREDELILPPLRVSPPNTRKETLWEATRVKLSQQFEVLQQQLEQHVYEWSWASAALFERDAITVFRYSDFFTPTEMQFLLSVLHHPHISLTSREMLYARVKEKILVLAARRVREKWDGQPECSHSGACSSQWLHLVLGDNAVKCCITALQTVVTGGGGCALLHHASFRGYAHQAVHLRPMRMLLPREVLLYNRVHGITGGYTPALRTGTSLASIHSVLEEFVYRSTVTHRTVLFNVLTVVTRLDAQKLAPTTSGVLDCTKGVEHMEKKHMVFSKAMHHHHYLITHAPPILKGCGEHLCFCCGCPVSFCTPNAADARHLCVPCRDCINDTFSEKHRLDLIIWRSIRCNTLSLTLLFYCFPLSVAQSFCVRVTLARVHRFVCRTLNPLAIFLSTRLYSFVIFFAIHTQKVLHKVVW
eukprot:gene4289-3105_t